MVQRSNDHFHNKFSKKITINISYEVGERSKLEYMISMMAVDAGYATQEVYNWEDVKI